MRNKFKLVILGAIVLSVVLTAGCGSEEAESTLDIEAGTSFVPSDSLTIGPMPSLVGLLLSNGNAGANCTGAFVGPTLILTAAHCVSDFKDGYKLSLKLTNNASLADVPVAKTIAHPSYLPLCLGVCPDIAFISLAPTPTQATILQAFSLPAPISYATPKVGKSAVIAGFGCDKRPYPILDECEATFNKNFWKYEVTKVTGLNHPINVASNAYFGTDGSTGRAAPGDSGGPVYDSSGRIVGVTALSVKGFENSYHTALYSEEMALWLKDIMAKEGKATTSHQISDPKFVTPANQRCMYVNTVAQTWKNGSFAKCPLHQKDASLYNMTLTSSTYKCGSVVLSDSALLTRGSTICRNIFSCMTAPYQSASQSGC